MARIRPFPTTTDLNPPTVVGSAPQTVYLSVNLTYSRRGRPIYKLRRPTVIDLRPQVYYLAVTLAPSRRGRPIAFLREPILARVYAPVSVILT